MDLTRALAWLDEHINLEATAGVVEGLSLERMRALAVVLGDPQRAYPVIHITGTNGKGSTARMVAGVLAEAGLSVGTYSSPHVERINERLAWNGADIDDDALGAVLADIAAVEGLLPEPPSWFEIVTGAAFRWFAELAVDVAVIEVGLLGRWDATNVADGMVAVITNVGHDHTDGVGDWRRAIAEEKSGIVKPGSTLVLGEPDEALRPVFMATPAREIVLRGDGFDCEANRLAVGGRLVDLRTPRGRYPDVFVPLHGAHQGANAAIAVAAVEAFFEKPVDADVVAAGLASVRMPGRFEILGREPLVVIDGAHNPDGAAAAAATLRDDFATAGSRILVFGMLGGRDPQVMLTALSADGADVVLTCTAPSPRAVPSAELAAVAESAGIAAEACGSVRDALGRALAVADEADSVLVAGSLYVAGEARRAWREIEGVVGRSALS